MRIRVRDGAGRSRATEIRLAIGGREAPERREHDRAATELSGAFGGVVVCGRTATGPPDLARGGEYVT